MSRRVAHCYELCALNPYFSQRLRARRWHLGLTCGWRNVTVDVRPDRVAASKTGYGESTKERTIASVLGTQWAHDDDARGKCSRTRTRTRACFAGKETVPYRRQLYSRRKIVSTHARARDATRAHMSAHAARNKGDTSTMGLITKSGTISWEFVGNGDLRNSPDCCGSEYKLRVTMLQNATCRDSRSQVGFVENARACAAYEN